VDNTEFKKLKDTWYLKLKKSGFDDIEDNKGNLKSWDSFKFIRSSKRNMDKTETYYRYCSYFYWEYKFKNMTEKYIWKRHSEGATIRIIAEELQKKPITLKKSAIQNIVKSLRKKMMDLYKDNI